LVVKCAAQRVSTQTFRMASTLPSLPVFEAIAKHDPSSTAVIHSASGRRFTYGQLLNDVAETKDKLTAEAQRDSIEGERIAFLVENSYDYVGMSVSALNEKNPSTDTP
jgi:acyl-CoA synthetase (AMP-forming)/AMP-acid ligase II